jgi:glutamate synthase domain-containing protein 3
VQPPLEAVGGQGPPTLLIPEIRDYQKINAELVALLDQGHPLIRLEGAEGQRLLASGLSGRWVATIEILGRTGPELAAGIDAPGLVIVAKGSTADGVGSGLANGRIIVLGDAGDGAGYGQSGGILVITGSTGHRAGLRQSGGTLVLLGPVGRLASDRQSGGFLFARGRWLGPHSGRGRTGGTLVDWDIRMGDLPPDVSPAFDQFSEFAIPWLPKDFRLGP